MQNRLATAIVMAFGAALGRAEEEGRLSVKDSGYILDNTENFVASLLRDKVVDKVDGNIAYPPMQLSGLNEVASGYERVVKEWLDRSVEPEGYQE